MRRLYVAILIFFLSFFFSCTPKVEEKPNYLIEENKLQDIAIELHLLESYVEKTYKNKDTAQAAFNYLEQKIYEKHKVDQVTYRDSYQFYIRNTKIMDKIYEEIVDSLGRAESRLKMKK